MAKKNKIKVPFPEPRPSSDSQYKFKFVKPTSINVIGGYALKSIARTKGKFNVDLAVEMPSVSTSDDDPSTISDLSTHLDFNY